MDNKKSANQLDTMMEGWFKSLPPLPANIVDVIFKFTPILSLVFGVLGTFVGIAGLGVLSFLAPFAMAAGTNGYGLGIVATIGLIISSIIMVVAYPALKAGKLSGWTLLFWSQVVSVLTSIVGIHISSVIGAAIGFYILYQIKPRFK